MSTPPQFNKNDILTLIQGIVPVPSRWLSVRESLSACQSSQNGILTINLKFQTD